MSSATSIDRDSFRPWHFFVLVSLVAATVAVVIARQARPEQLILISLTIGAAGFAAATLYRTFAPLVSKDPSRYQASLTDSMRSALEREKALVLRSIKELEFDRAMGKVSAKDFEEMAGRLRSRAMTLMRQLDADGSGYRELIERELSARLPRAAARKTAPVATVAATCACGTQNDRDAVFCKRCGSKLAGPAES
jgi:hypothetical protein